MAGSVKHRPQWEIVSRERESGSLVMWVTRRCKICGAEQEDMRTLFDSWFRQPQWRPVPRKDSSWPAASTK